MPRPGTDAANWKIYRRWQEDAGKMSVVTFVETKTRSENAKITIGEVVH